MESPDKSVTAKLAYYKAKPEALEGKSEKELERLADGLVKGAPNVLGTRSLHEKRLRERTISREPQRRGANGFLRA